MSPEACGVPVTLAWLYWHADILDGRASGYCLELNTLRCSCVNWIRLQVAEEILQMPRDGDSLNSEYRLVGDIPARAALVWHEPLTNETGRNLFDISRLLIKHAYRYYRVKLTISVTIEFGDAVYSYNWVMWVRYGTSVKRWRQAG